MEEEVRDPLIGFLAISLSVLLALASLLIGYVIGIKETRQRQQKKPYPPHWPRIGWDGTKQKSKRPFLIIQKALKYLRLKQ